MSGPHFQPPPGPCCTPETAAPSDGSGLPVPPKRDPLWAAPTPSSAGRASPHSFCCIDPGARRAGGGGACHYLLCSRCINASRAQAAPLMDVPGQGQRMPPGHASIFGFSKRRWRRGGRWGWGAGLSSCCPGLLPPLLPACSLRQGVGGCEAAKDRGAGSQSYSGRGWGLVSEQAGSDSWVRRAGGGGGGMTPRSHPSHGVVVSCFTSLCLSFPGGS